MSDYEATISLNPSATIRRAGDYGRATIRCRRLFASDYRLLSDYDQRLSGDYHTRGRGSMDGAAPVFVPWGGAGLGARAPSVGG